MVYRGHRTWLRCNECRTRRGDIGLLMRHLKASPECKPCTCGGYHYRHRSGSTYCEANPDCYPNRASRAGASEDDVSELRARIAKERECPF